MAPTTPDVEHEQDPAQGFAVIQPLPSGIPIPSFLTEPGNFWEIYRGR
jgi:hypothetical protein